MCAAQGCLCDRGDRGSRVLVGIAAQQFASGPAVGPARRIASPSPSRSALLNLAGQAAQGQLDGWGQTTLRRALKERDLTLVNAGKQRCSESNKPAETALDCIVIVRVEPRRPHHAPG
jgi:hypothetical protein